MFRAKLTVATLLVGKSVAALLTLSEPIENHSVSGSESRPHTVQSDPSVAAARHPATLVQLVETFRGSLVTHWG